MRTMLKLCEVNSGADSKLAANGFEDKSGVGVHYMDAYIKPMNAELEDGTKVTCKRRGLKITLAVGDKKGDGLMRRVDVSQDPVEMMQAALKEAAEQAGVELKVEDGAIFVQP